MGSQPFTELFVICQADCFTWVVSSVLNCCHLSSSLSHLGSQLCKLLLSVGQNINLDHRTALTYCLLLWLGITLNTIVYTAYTEQIYFF